MVDSQTFLDDHSNLDVCQISTFSPLPFDTWPQKILNTENLSQLETILLPPDIPAFFLAEQKWGASFPTPNPHHAFVDHFCMSNRQPPR